MKYFRMFVWALLLLLLPAAALCETQIVTLTCTGDFMPGSNDKVSAQPYAFQRYIEQYGYAYPCEGVRELLENDDITLVNFECVLNDTAALSASRYRFRGPTAYAAILPACSIEVVSFHQSGAGRGGGGPVRQYGIRQRGLLSRRKGRAHRVRGRAAPVE